MKLEDFKKLTLEERLDYLFEHSVKDSEQRFADEKHKWCDRNDCDHEWEDIGFGQSQCTYPECQMIKSNCSLSSEP